MRPCLKAGRASGQTAAFVGLVVVAALSPRAAAAQDSPALELVDVTLWPEYDRPAMLVICRARLAPGVQLPTVMTLPMPAAVETPHAVARRGENNTLLVADYTREVKGDVAWVKITTDSPDVQFEYYQEMARDGLERSFTYEWPAYVDVGELSFEVQLPPGATAATVLPPPERQEPGEGGRIFYYGGLGQLTKRAGGSIKVTYARSADNLASVQADTPVAAANESSQTGSGPAWVWAVLAVAIVLFAMSIVVFLKSGKKTTG